MTLSRFLPLLQLLSATSKKAALYTKNIKQSAKKRTTLFLTSVKIWVTSFWPMRLCRLRLKKNKKTIKQDLKPIIKNLSLSINKLWTGFSPSAVWHKWKLNYEKLLFTIHHQNWVLFTQTSLLCGKFFSRNEKKPK